MKTAKRVVEILRGIREDLGQVRDATTKNGVEIAGLRVDTNQRFDEMARRIVESELRTATAITQLVGTMHNVDAHLNTQNTLLQALLDMRPRLERCERDIEHLKTRLPDA